MQGHVERGLAGVCVGSDEGVGCCGGGEMVIAHSFKLQQHQEVAAGCAG